MYQLILIVVLFLIVLYLLYQNYTIQREIYKIKNSFDELNNFLDLSIKKTKPKVLDTLSSINTTDITDNIITYSNDVKRVKVETTIGSEENLKNKKNSKLSVKSNKKEDNKKEDNKKITEEVVERKILKEDKEGGDEEDDEDVDEEYDDEEDYEEGEEVEEGEEGEEEGEEVDGEEVEEGEGVKNKMKSLQNEFQPLEIKDTHMNDLKLIQLKINNAKLVNNQLNTADSDDFEESDESSGSDNNIKIIKDYDEIADDEIEENNDQSDEIIIDNKNQLDSILNNIKDAIKHELNDVTHENEESTDIHIVLNEDVNNGADNGADHEQVEQVKEEAVKDEAEKRVERVEQVKEEQVKEEVVISVERENVKGVEEITAEELNKMNIANVRLEAKKHNIVLSITGKAKAKDVLIKEILAKINNH